MAKNQQAAVNETMGVVGDIRGGPFGTQVANFAAVHQVGGHQAAKGTTDFDIANLHPGEVNADTIFGEGSIGKVRFAGLAYMLEDEGKIDLNVKVTDFFERADVLRFLKRKYPESPDLSMQIIGLFKRKDNKDATLADLTTHYSGIGDNTKGNAETLAKEGIRGNWSLSKLLGGIKRNVNGQILANGPPDRDIIAEYGKHQYSNLGYMLLGTVIEATVNRENTDVQLDKTYQDIMNERMLRPIEGRAVESGIIFERTGFPARLQLLENVALAQIIDVTGEAVDVREFQGAGSAGGMFTSANDSAKFFQEFFRGFPGTDEYRTGQPDSNQFLSDGAIERMTQEWRKHPPAGFSKNGNARYQGPGFVVEVEGNNKDKILTYEKNGETFGFDANMVFYTATGTVDIAMIASENVTVHYAQEIAKQIVEIAGPQDYAISHPLMQENIKETMAYLRIQYSVAELKSRAAQIVRIVSENIIDNNGMIPQTRVELDPSPADRMRVSLERMESRASITNKNDRHQPIEALALDALSPKLKQLQMEEASFRDLSRQTPTTAKSIVEKMQSNTGRGSREV